MAALYGRLTGGRPGAVTRAGTTMNPLTSRLETWEGSIETTLEADGTFSVKIGDKSSPRTTIAVGNVNDRKWEAT